jgi:Family of unknown function (DUF6069)
MSTLSTTSTVSWGRTAAAAGIGAVGGFVINTVISLIARGPFDASDEFMPLQPPAYGTFTLIGAIVGAVGWHLIVSRARNAPGVLRVLVPTVLVLSLIPDVLLLVNRDAQPGITTAGVVALMFMHLGVAAAAVPAYLRFIPPRS